MAEADYSQNPAIPVATRTSMAVLADLEPTISHSLTTKSRGSQKKLRACFMATSENAHRRVGKDPKERHGPKAVPMLAITVRTRTYAAGLPQPTAGQCLRGPRRATQRLPPGGKGAPSLL